MRKGGDKHDEPNTKDRCDGFCDSYVHSEFRPGNRDGSRNNGHNKHVCGNDVGYDGMGVADWYAGGRSVLRLQGIQERIAQVG